MYIYDTIYIIIIYQPKSKHFTSILAIFGFQIERDKKLAKMVGLLLFVWFLAWTPYATMNSWILFFDFKRLSPIFGVIPTICCKLSAGANALLYGIRYLAIFLNLIHEEPSIVVIKRI